MATRTRQLSTEAEKAHVLIRRLHGSEERRFAHARQATLDAGLGPEMAALAERAARAEAEGLDHHRNRTILRLYATGHEDAARTIEALGDDG